MAPYEALYERRFHSPVGLFEPGEGRMLSTDLVRDALEKVKLIQDRLHTTQFRQKSYANWRARDVEFMVGERVFLRISPMQGVMRFRKNGKLSPRYIVPYEILERVGDVAYKLALLHSLLVVHSVFHISVLQKYYNDSSYVLDFSSVHLEKDFTYVKEPVSIMDRQIPVLVPVALSQTSQIQLL
ncbi:uncharacterized protein [Nicotiana tomentosiformis]|uniref:uncharacterized protein n=1 Tax=Nicotiana tomentosiformis TaxID=4098 RepID=UPI00388CBC39